VLYQRGAKPEEVSARAQGTVSRGLALKRIRLTRTELYARRLAALPEPPCSQSSGDDLFAQDDPAGLRQASFLFDAGPARLDRV